MLLLLLGYCFEVTCDGQGRTREHEIFPHPYGLGPEFIHSIFILYFLSLTRNKDDDISFLITVIKNR